MSQISYNSYLLVFWQQCWIRIKHQSAVLIIWTKITTLLFPHFCKGNSILMSCSIICNFQISLPSWYITLLTAGTMFYYDPVHSYIWCQQNHRSFWFFDMLMSLAVIVVHQYIQHNNLLLFRKPVNLYHLPHTIIPLPVTFLSFSSTLFFSFNLEPPKDTVSAVCQEHHLISLCDFLKNLQCVCNQIS